MDKAGICIDFVYSLREIDLKRCFIEYRSRNYNDWYINPSSSRITLISKS